MGDDTSLSLSTTELYFWVSELQAGRPDAAEPTFRKIVSRVDRFARRTTQKFPRVERFVDVEDVIQNCLIRLLAAFRDIRPQSRQHFYRVVNELIRRELLDLTKHYFGPQGHGANLSGVSIGEEDGEYSPLAPNALEELDRGAAFHEAVAELPIEEREAIGLTYYHGWSQRDISDLFQVSVRTVQRWLESATAKLKARVA